MSLASADPRAAGSRRVLSVWELTARVKDMLECEFAGVAVGGEISNYSQPSSGHSYFTLKDDRAQIRAVLWRSTAARLRFDLHDGLEVVCVGDLEVYAPRGTYQLVVRDLLPRGLGGLELALRQLRDRLAAGGLFDPLRKRPLPRLPRRIAVVTSPTSAALHDFLEALARRWPGADVLVAPTRVQGPGAALEIAAAIAAVNGLRPRPDVLVVTRGGGSLEDLWAFNEEPVVRAICASATPVVSGVGHEIDVTLADLAADVRALTPTDAAAKVAPSLEELTAYLAQCEQRLSSHWQRRLALARHRFEALAGRRLWQQPQDLLAPWARRVDDLEGKLLRAGRGRLEQAAHRLHGMAGRLDALSPLAVLARGYSLTQREADGGLLSDAREAHLGERIVSRLARGEIISRVERVVEESDDER